MKRKTLILIAVASILIILVIGLWIYSLLNGQPGDRDRFADFPWGSGGVNEFPFEPVEEPVDESLINIAGQPLRQLTFRPTIGYAEIIKNSTRFLRYVEAGTGHIYDINLNTGQEERVSNITLANAHEAVVKRGEGSAFIRAGFTASSEIVQIVLNGDSPRSVPLSFTMNSFHLDTNDQLIFTTRTNTGIEARRLGATATTSQLLFTIPFLNAHIAVPTTNNRPNFVYTKPASELTGYAYEINGSGALVRLPLIGPGLTAIHTGSYIPYSVLSGSTYRSYIYNRRTGEVADAPIVILPEKCTPSLATDEILFCGHEITTYDNRFPDEWYKGVRQFSDSLWSVDLVRQSATQLSNPQTAVVRNLDMTHLTHVPHDTSDMIYFINRNDKTLWVYELAP